MKTLFFSSVLSLISWLALAQPDLRVKHFNLDDGVALQGYDPVAYFMQHKAIKGNPKFAYTKNSVTYYLSSATNLDLFTKDNKKYEPQYGGWCAYAMGESGDKVEVDPETFKIVGGKLYLFYNSLFNNTLPKWNKNEVDLKKRADENWKAAYQ